MTQVSHDDLQMIARFPFGRIVVASDGGPSSEHALEWARELARLGSSRVWLLHVAPGIVTGAAAFGLGTLAPDPAHERELLARAERALDVQGAEGLLGYGDPARGILSLASDMKADLVIVGTHGHSLPERMLLGSVADAVRLGARCSVLLARSAPSGANVMAAVDGSHSALHAAGVAAALADSFGGRLTLCHVASGDARLDGVPDVLGGVAAAHRGPVTKVVTVGDPAESILKEAKARDASLIVMGDRGLGRIRRAIMGSVSTQVVREADTSVLVVRRPSP